MKQSCFFSQQFRDEGFQGDYSLLENVPKIIIERDNDAMTTLPEEREVRDVVFSLNKSSAFGPDWFTRLFYQTSWDIIGEDISRLVKVFVCSQELAKFITHTNLVLLSKNEIVKGFVDLRLISLSGFANKIISKVIHGQISGVLPKIISQNQSGFI